VSVAVFYFIITVEDYFACRCLITCLLTSRLSTETCRWCGGTSNQGAGLEQTDEEGQRQEYLQVRYYSDF
jgi:hypothetical protein